MTNQQLLAWNVSNGRRNEDDLLLKYWGESQGLVFAEVPVAGRRIDAVRIVNSSLTNDIILWNKTNADELRRALYHSETIAVEIIEIKSKDLNGDAIGQVIAGSDFLEESFPRLSSERMRRVVLCTSFDSPMKVVCEKYGIQIWSSSPSQHSRMKRLTPITQEQSILLSKYLQRFRGRIFTEVNVYGRRIDAIRIVSQTSGGKDNMLTSANPQEPWKTIGDIKVEGIEIIKVMPGHFGRSAFGQLLSESAMFEEKCQEIFQHSQEGISKVLIRTVADSPMEKVCEKHGIKVWPEPSDNQIIVSRRR